MTLTEVINILNNKITALRNQRELAIKAGDLQLIERIDAEIEETLITLNTLNLS